MEIKVDTPIEVTQKQYRLIMFALAGVVAGREDDNGKFFIKVWDMRYADSIKEILKETSV